MDAIVQAVREASEQGPTGRTVKNGVLLGLLADGAESCVKREEKLATQTRLCCSYQRHASSTSAAAAGRKIACFTQECP